MGEMMSEMPGGWDDEYIKAMDAERVHPVGFLAGAALVLALILAVAVS